jgi:mono/diheme cytochrome c family protein/glucose/arabinose dehydrogenase
MKSFLSICVILVLSLAAINLLAADGQLPPRPRPPMLSPEEALKTFELPPGYRLEVVLSEPVIKEPVITVFDGNGRMFVAEMRGYMQEIDGQNQLDPVSRVSMHEDTNRDGQYDKHTVFIDKLVLPRMLLPLDGSLLVVETDSGDINQYWDTDGDGVADKKKLFYRGEERRANLEHQPSGLIWSMDNWMYTTYNAWRIRWTPNGIVREPTASNGGQWGLAQDNYGKPWFVNAGGERGPLNFQVPIVYGAFNSPGQFAPNYTEVYPLVPIPDVQGGKIRFRPVELTLNHFTATCGAEIVRADQLPDDMQGDLLFAEPVGRLIRRSKVDVRDGLTYLRNTNPDSEFIRSSDPNFRPVNIANAPDGSVYITDMYRGIIQEGNWVRPGSYLRTIVEQYQFDKNIGHGRIWRLTYDGNRSNASPRMLDQSPSQLVQYLDHPNGWWRDTAQKLIILRQDKTVVPELKRTANSSRNELARIQAIWTLEGLGALDAEFLRERLKDNHPQVRAAAIRASETLFKQGDDSLALDLKLASLDSDSVVVIQALLTMAYLKFEQANAIIENTVAGSRSSGVAEIARQILKGGDDGPPPVRFSAAERKRLARGAAIYKELCFACHGDDGKGTLIEGTNKTMAPSLAASKTVNGHPDGLINVLLYGLSGPIDGKSYDALMVPMGANEDEWIAAITSYVRNSFGNHGGFVGTKEVARARQKTTGRLEPWTIDELRATLPQPLANKKEWKLSASHNADKVGAAIDGNAKSRFDTGATQVPGMWFQIELPEAAEVAQITLDANGSDGDYPRRYEVLVSDDGTNWSPAIAKGRGDGPVTEITFDPVRTRFIRINQTGKVDGLFWSIHELGLFEPGRAIDYAKQKVKPVAESFE